MKFTQDQLNFLTYVKNYIKDNPEIAPHVSDFIGAGIHEALKESKNRANDMECALAMTIWGKRTDKEMIRSYIGKWLHKASLQWDWFFKDEQKTAKEGKSK